jgi:uridine phosphorylase
MDDQMPATRLPPIRDNKHHDDPAVFKPENLLREARRQRHLPHLSVPEICILDPDGDIVRALRADGRGEPFPGWACYHTEMLAFELGGEHVGIVGCAVGTSFAVLVAEQMFASGCRLLISITSAGRIAAGLPEQSFFVVIEKALRDEGTSYHYAPADQRFAHGDPKLTALAARALVATGLPVLQGAVWTTDAPFRETTKAIATAARDGLLAAEMEAAALYAFAAARRVPVVCLAHVTNQMAQIEGDFEKGDGDGSKDALTVLSSISISWRQYIR